MKILLVLAAVLTTHDAFPAEIDPKLFRMIGPNATLVTGVNVERHQQSALAALFPMEDAAAQSIWIDNRDSTKLNILVGPHAKPDVETNDTLDLDAFTRLQYFGQLYTEDAAQQTRTVLAAFAQRLNAPEAPTTLAVRAQQLAGSYDTWFVIEKPLEALASTRRTLPWPLKYRDQLAATIEEVSGGIRFGTNIEVTVEALMRTNEDANALAALGRWLPGAVQLIADAGMPLLVDIAEDYTVTADGRRVTLAFHLAEDKVAEVVAKLNAYREQRAKVF